MLYAKRMHTRLESLRFLNAKLIDMLASTDFRLTFTTMQRRNPYIGSRSNWHEQNLDESEDTSIQKVYFEYRWLSEDGLFPEVRSTGEQEFQNYQVKHISDLTQPLTQEMARNFAVVGRLVLYSDHIDIVSSEVYGSLLKHLMAAIPAEKFLFVHCNTDNFERPLETLIQN